MAAPVDAGRATTNVTSGVDPWTVNLPTGIQSGDLLVLKARNAGGVDFVAPSGWSTLEHNNQDDGSNDKTSIYYRVADGSEGSTMTLDLAAAAKGAVIVWRITGAGTPAITSAVVASTSTPNPPATPSLTGDYLFIALGGQEGEFGLAFYPSSYLNGTRADSGTGGAVAANCQIFGATRQRTGLSSQTEDPGVFTLDGTEDTSVWTIYIPAGTTADSEADVSWAELEVPSLNAQAEVAWAEVEVPTVSSQAEVAWAEVEVPTANAEAHVSWAEVETPSLDAQADISWAELEVPTASSQAEISWAEVEVPTAQSQAEVSFAEFEVPSFAVDDAQAEIAWVELEVPLADCTAEVAWLELEVPTAPAQAEVALAEIETPFAPAAAEIAWAEMEVPTASAWAEVSWMELEAPFVQAGAEVAFVELQVSDVGVVERHNRTLLGVGE